MQTNKNTVMINNKVEGISDGIKDVQMQATDNLGNSDYDMNA